MENYIYFIYFMCRILNLKKRHKSGEILKRLDFEEKVKVFQDSQED